MGGKDDPKHLPDPVADLDETIVNLDNLHQKSSIATQQLGFALKACKDLRPGWAEIIRQAGSNDEVKTLVASGTAVVEAYKTEVEKLENEVSPSFERIERVAKGVNSLITAAGTTSSFLGMKPIWETFHFPGETTFRDYANRFDKLDPSLGKVYREISEILLGTRSDPERAALYLLRQAFDHFFSRLAPDEEIRSQIRDLKEDDQSNKKISRKERIEYVISQHIKDNAQAKRLGASVDHMIDVYQALNGAHKRGEIDKLTARTALEEMDAILREMADAIGL